MGSLPDLRELTAEGGCGAAGAEPGAERGAEPGVGDRYRPGPALGRLCGGGGGGGGDSSGEGEPPPLSQEEKTRILHRYSGHGRPARLCHAPGVAAAGAQGAAAGEAQGAFVAGRPVYDDAALEHLSTYSPMSGRSARHYHLPARRRDSPSSSIGATSVRRLLAAVVRPGPSSRAPPTPSRRTLLRNLALLCAVNALLAVAQLPYLALQGSVSVWAPPAAGVNSGSLLLALAYLVACPTALLGPALVRRVGARRSLALALLTLALAQLALLGTEWAVLATAAAVWGAAQGPLAAALTHRLLTLAGRLTRTVPDEEEELRARRRTCVVRRAARAFRAGHDLGLIVGSALSALVVVYAANWDTSYPYGYPGANSTILYTTDADAAIVLSCVNSTPSAGVTANCTDLSPTAVDSDHTQPFDSAPPPPEDYASVLDALFDQFEGGRLCGALACPSPAGRGTYDNTTAALGAVLPPRSARALAAAYASALLAALVLLAAGGLDRVRAYVPQDPLERSAGLAALGAVRETFADGKLRMAAPLAVFVGLEQAFIYADFGKSYVVCTLGIHRLNLVFLAMGVLQSIAACTLSMLLRSIRRYYVVAVGMAFHACLIMVLMLWKPIEDDPALFYVISASWGVCNAIWEMLNFTLLTGLYADNWEAPFANSTFFRFAGLSLGFGVHGLLCNNTKLWALAAALVISVVPFAWLEARLESQRKVRNITRL